MTADFEGYRRLSAAVIAQACKHLDNPVASEEHGKHRKGRIAARRTSARKFLAGDMWPYAEMINLDPETDQAFREFCARHGIER